MADSIMNKNICEYEAFVFDLDGTLYFQRALRVRMAFKLVSYYLCHIADVKELYAIKKFREFRENWDEIERDTAEDKAFCELLENICTDDLELDRRQYAYTAYKLGMTYDSVRSTIRRWMYDSPLDAIYKTRDKELLDVISGLKNAGKKIFVFSDYPIEEKLNALNMTCDGMYSATDDRIGELKPSPKGLELIMADTGYNSSEVLMVGDRMSRDGMSAINAGCDYIILSKSKIKRKKQLRLFRG